jgi:dihydroxyacetone synthase
MAPSLEFYQDVASGLPVAPTKMAAINGVSGLELEESEKHDLVLRVFRCLIADLCEQFGGGHPGYV